MWSGRDGALPVVMRVAIMFPALLRASPPGWFGLPCSTPH